MDAVVHWSEALFRWIHVVAGVLWIGHLYFFNFVNAQFAKTLDGETRPKVVPELMPRALFWFRWGAAYTWITGFLLLGLVYYMQSGNMTNDPKQAGFVSAIGVSILVIGFVVYDLVWRSLQAQEMVAFAISGLLLLGLILSLHFGVHMNPRGLFIHIGAMFGTIMAANVWMRIWPNQRKIIAAVKAGQAPDPSWGALAGLRSKHNTYMSVPLIYTMVAAHNTGALYLGGNSGWLALVAAIGIGWAATWRLYQISATPSPAAY